MQRAKPAFFASQIRWSGLLSALGALVIAGTVAGFLAQYFWLCDLIVNFRVQLFLASVAGVSLVLWKRRYWLGLLYGGTAALNLAVILPLYFSGHPSVPPSNAVHLRAALLNVHTDNRRFDAVREFVSTERPDIIVFEEVNDEWMKELRSLNDLYPHQLAEPRFDNFGIALFSRWPLLDPKIVEIGDSSTPTILTRVVVREKTLTLIGTHPLPPASLAYFASRNRQLAAVARLIPTLAKPCVLLGDLNATPWSPYYKDFLAESGLRDAMRGHGVNATWPAQFFPLWIPIDRCLVSPEIGVLRARVGPALGSDHFPIIVDLAF